MSQRSADHWSAKVVMIPQASLAAACVFASVLSNAFVGALAAVAASGTATGGRCAAACGAPVVFAEGVTFGAATAAGGFVGCVTAACGVGVGAVIAGFDAGAVGWGAAVATGAWVDPGSGMVIGPTIGSRIVMPLGGVVGTAVGAGDGSATLVGAGCDGAGAPDGCAVGAVVGSAVGTALGCALGAVVGGTVGAAVGDGATVGTGGAAVGVGVAGGGAGGTNAAPRSWISRSLTRYPFQCHVA
jgi:hypothetical protein